jgi:spore maturation protein CgeB
MKLVVFGLTVSSSWGNGHATLWRGLIEALSARGHTVVFFERDLPFYAPHRDLRALPGASELLLYAHWEEVQALARRHLAEADVGMVTSYCPDALAATEAVLGSGRALKTFYDLDTPVTLARQEAGERVEYVGPRGLGPFDLVLSYTGGEALRLLGERFGARQVVPLYGSVDPQVHHPVPPRAQYRGDLSYLGTWAANRQEALERFFLAPARRLPRQRFMLGGAQYPADFPWTDNVYFVRHLPPAEHPAFYCSSALTLNVTRAPMAALGYCPSGRLFEAAACGVPVLSDAWAGLEHFFTPGEELLLARTSEDAVAALSLPREVLQRMGARARERALVEHTAERRAQQLVQALEAARSPAPAGAEWAGGATG